MTMTDTSVRWQVHEHMPVVCSNSKQFGTVDRVEGEHIKLTKDDQGQHHWIPMDWVTRVDEHVHVDRPDDQAMREWITNPPPGAGMTGSMQGTATTQGMSGMQGMEGQESGQPGD